MRNSGDLDLAYASFRTGRFNEAEARCRSILEEDPEDMSAAAYLGHIALMSNRLVEAQSLLSKVVENGHDERTMTLLAETFYRRDRFLEAALLFRRVGKEVKAKKLESFQGKTPYQTIGDFPSKLKFVQTDPLPVVELTVNDSEEGYFLVDTGGSELIIDDECARRVGASIFGEETGTFGGGKQAGFMHGTIDSLKLGTLTVENIPVNIIDTRRFSGVAQGRRISGIVGTVLLYHFLAIIDYPDGALVLESVDHRPNSVEKTRGECVEVPFRMAGDHYMVSEGTVNGRPMLLFLDTGLAGLGFTCPQSTIAETEIKLNRSLSSSGAGGGGEFDIVPFTVDRVSLGEASQENVQGVFGAFPPSLEFAHRFRIGGLLSHGFFRNYRTTFDFRTMRVSLTKGGR